jgi:pyrimidine operon attenuation protein/uracil phosphoribosyltransferase
MNQIMSADDLSRATTRIAHEIVEANQGTDNLVLLGIPTRGIPFAHRLADALSSIGDKAIEAGSLDIGMYRDDIDTRPKTRIGPTEIPEPIDGKVVVLTDDVLFTGRTIRAALDALVDLGRPSAVQLAVVVDRGHRQLPIRADYVGKNIPTAITEHVAVRFAEIDGDDGVYMGDSDHETDSGNEEDE